MENHSFMEAGIREKALGFESSSLAKVGSLLHPSCMS